MLFLVFMGTSKGRPKEGHHLYGREGDFFVANVNIAMACF